MSGIAKTDVGEASLAAADPPPVNPGPLRLRGEGLKAAD